MIANGAKEAGLKEEEGGRGEGGGGEGGKRGGLIDVFCHVQMPRRYGTFPWASRKEGLEFSPTHIQNRPEPEFELSVNTRGDLPLNPQLRLRVFNQVPESKTRGQEKPVG